MANGHTKKISKGHQKVIDAGKMKHNLKDNSFWDDCNNHYKIAVDAVHQVEGQLAIELERIVNTPELVSKIENHKQLEENLTVLHKDITAHMQRLEDIHQNHKDKKGGISTPEEGLEVIQINGQYQEAAEIYNAVVLPTVCHVFEQIAPAQKAMYDSLSLTDPTVISDAVIKGE
jgi:hypothetical protein